MVERVWLVVMLGTGPMRSLVRQTYRVNECWDRRIQLMETKIEFYFFIGGMGSVPSWD